jgi:hypothetical protein
MVIMSENMYKPKEENVEKLKEYLSKKDKSNNTIFVIKKDRENGRDN